jgi:hypothetical protein
MAGGRAEWLAVDTARRYLDAMAKLRDHAISGRPAVPIEDKPPRSVPSVSDGEAVPSASWDGFQGFERVLVPQGECPNRPLALRRRLELARREFDRDGGQRRR